MESNQRLWCMFVLQATVLFSTQASAQPCRGCTPVQKQYAYLNFAITNISPWPTVEHGPIDVSFEVVPEIIGVASSDPAPKRVRVCPVTQKVGITCKDFGNLAAGQKGSGTIRAFAPAAASAAIVRIQIEEEPTPPSPGVEVFHWNPRNEAVRAMPVFATYEIAVDEFEVLHTRSTLEDTIDFYLQGIVVSEPPHPSFNNDGCPNLSGNFCVKKYTYGDADDGRHPLAKLRVGPFSLTPEVEQQLGFHYTLVNFGDDYARDVIAQIANVISMGGSIALKAQGSGGSYADSLDSGIQSLHAKWAASCDGPVAADAYYIWNVSGQDITQTLNSLTRDTGVFRRTVHNYKEKDEDPVCGAGGNYSVTYAVYRTSWQAE